MLLLEIIAFLGAFIVAVLLLNALLGTGASDVVSTVPRRPLDGAGHLQLADFRKTVTLSAVPWLNQLLHRLEIGSGIRALLAQAEVNWTAGSLLLMCACGFSLSALLVYRRVGSLLVALAVGALIGSQPLVYVLWKRSRRFAKFELALPHALDMLVSALRAGHSFNAALGLASRECSEPVRGELKVCSEEQNYGLDLGTAIENLALRVPLADLRIAATAILIQKESGGNLAEVLSNTADVIRERFRLRRQVRVHTAHGRMTGWAITFLPLALLLALYVINPEMESILWRRDIGVKSLCGAGAMMTLGFIVIQKIIRVQV